MVLASIETFFVAYGIIAVLILVLAYLTAQPMNDEPIENDMEREDDEKTSARKAS